MERIMESIVARCIDCYVSSLSYELCDWRDVAKGRGEEIEKWFQIGSFQEENVWLARCDENFMKLF